MQPLSSKYLQGSPVSPTQALLREFLLRPVQKKIVQVVSNSFSPLSGESVGASFASSGAFSPILQDPLPVMKFYHSKTPSPVTVRPDTPKVVGFEVPSAAEQKSAE